MTDNIRAVFYARLDGSYSHHIWRSSLLPDFISIKKQVTVDLEGSLSADKDKDSFMSQVPTYLQHEGCGSIILRDDGSEHKSDYKRMGSNITIDLMKVQSKGERAIQEAVTAAHEELELSKKKFAFEVIGKTVEEVGNSLNAGGKPLSAELILEMWEKLEFSFDENGNWLQPTFVFNPIQEPRVRAAFEKLETDPELIRRKEELIARKKEEWDVREANRKLVD